LFEKREEENEKKKCEKQEVGEKRQGRGINKRSKKKRKRKDAEDAEEDTEKNCFYKKKNYGATDKGLSFRNSISKLLSFYEKLKRSDEISLAEGMNKSQK